MKKIKLQICWNASKRLKFFVLRNRARQISNDGRQVEIYVLHKFQYDGRQVEKGNKNLYFGVLK